MGLGWASCLLKAGMAVTLVARPVTVTALHEQGLIRDGLFGSFHAHPHQFEAYTSLAEIPPQSFDAIVVCTKSFDSAGAAQDLQNYPTLLSPETPLVLAQNGWGNTEHFLDRFGLERIFNARVITGFERPQPHHVTVTVHADAIHIGSPYGQPQSRVSSLAQAMAQGDIPCITTDAIVKDLWAKMLFNCTLNPLGAILDVPYGALAGQPSTTFLMNQIIDEIFAVCRAAGLPLHWETPMDFQNAFYGQQVPATANHRSSTLQDIKAGKRTEIDALNGQVLLLAQRHGLVTPYNESVYRLIKFTERAGLDST